MVSTASMPEAAVLDAALEKAAVGAPGSPVWPPAACGAAAGGSRRAARGSVVPSGSRTCWMCALLLDQYQSGNNVRNSFRNNF